MAEQKPHSTIAEIGPVLPLGVLGDDGVLHKDIAVRPWRMKEERELGSLRDQNKDASIFQYVGMVLATMLTRLGPHDLDAPGMTLQKKRFLIGQLAMCDVLYAYIWLRMQALGEKMDISVTCPQCASKIENWSADLGTVEVTTAQSAEEATWSHKLHNPFVVRGKMVGCLVLGPPRWNSLEQLQSRSGPGMAKPAVIRASIVSALTKDGEKEVEQVVLADHEIDEMSKRDIEAIAAEVNDKSIGPKMVVEGDCNFCSNHIVLPIDWGYDNFFASSSR